MYQSFTYIIDIYLLLWVIILYYCLFVAQIVPNLGIRSFYRLAPT